ncbi:TPA: hypothetical protein ACH3X1_004752 [Trebouxia sp. C0004]
MLAQGYATDASQEGLNALHIAAKDGNIQQCRKLLKQGVDINARTEDVYVSSVLHTGVVYGNKAMARLLLDHGADVNAER